MGEEVEVKKGKKGGKMGKRIVLAFVSLMFLAILGGACYGAWYFYKKYDDVKKNPEIITKEETAWVTEKVSKLMSIPQDETPTLATVLDKDKLKDQPFFKSCENGDKILVYTKAMKAILYRPDTNMIIEVMPLYIDDTKSEVNGATTPAQ